MLLIIIFSFLIIFIFIFLRTRQTTLSILPPTLLSTIQSQYITMSIKHITSTNHTEESYTMEENDRNSDIATPAVESQEPTRILVDVEGVIALEEPSHNDQESSATSSTSSSSYARPIDNILECIVCVVVWGPLFIALMVLLWLSGNTDTKPTTSRDNWILVGIVVGVISVFVYILTMLVLSRRWPLRFLVAVYWTLFLYVDVVASTVLSLIVIGPALKDYHHEYANILIANCLCLLGWLILVLTGRGVLLSTHAYSWGETMPFAGTDGSDAGRRTQRFQVVLQRGINEKAFRYKYVPKTHLQISTGLWIICWTIYAGTLWTFSWAITVPVGALCAVIFTGSNTRMLMMRVHKEKPAHITLRRQLVNFCDCTYHRLL